MTDLKSINNIRKQLWKQEKKFFLLQIAKIFIHINPKSNDFNDFLVNPLECNSKQESSHKYKLNQTTSLLSYHIIKGANILFDNDFLNWINIDNLHPKSFFKFANYVLEKTHNQYFINMVNKAIKYIKSKSKFSKTLRMSSYEMQLFSHNVNKK
jgi:hypothetical protein